MTAMDPKQRYVLDLLATAELSDPPEAWAVLVTDEATGSVTVHAPYLDPLQAFAAAEKIFQETNRGRSESDTPPWNLGWSVRLAPCTPVTGHR